MLASLLGAGGRLTAELERLRREYLTHEDLIAAGKCKAGEQHEHLNRYCNLFPLDASRVVLSDGAYINASHIVLTGIETEATAERGFIAAQGPMHPDWHGPDTLPTFWQCVWEQRVNTIVCLATPQPGFTGFAQYWPDAGTSAAYGRWQVRCAATSTAGDQQMVRRELWVSDGDGGERRVQMIQTLCWPNYGVPEQTMPIRQLLRACRDARDEWGGTTLVHCSGGVGRSGTFLAAYAALASTGWRGEAAERPAGGPARLGADFSLLPIVRELRRQRHPMMVEGHEQYLFAYAVVADELGYS